MRPWYDDHSLWCDDLKTAQRRCEAAGCSEKGEHRAPFSPQQLNKYRWFCLDHVRAYNSGWDFAKGLNPEEIERIIRFDTIWQRETRPLGDWRMKENLLRAKASHFAFGQGQSGKTHAGPPPQIVAALAMFELDVMPDAEGLQLKYRKLVKKYHPDANGGDKMAEEQLKKINQAYAVLKAFLR